MARKTEARASRKTARKTARKPAARNAGSHPERVLVTGGAGFIGSHLVERLVEQGSTVTVVDNLSSGHRANLESVLDRITFVPADVRDGRKLDQLLPGVERVYHLAANPDVRSGAHDPEAHFRQNVHATWELLEAMRRNGVRNLAFTSTSTVYGRAVRRPTPESYGPLYPISAYGGAKLACEALIAAHCGTFGMDAQMFRFANVVGPRAGHGVILDFTKKLRVDPAQLSILGDGTQTKSYVSVEDTVSGMLAAVRRAEPSMGCKAYNIGSADAIDVNEVARIVARAVKARPTFTYSGGTKDGAGWVGDVKHMKLDTRALQRLGWRARHSSATAVRRAALWAAQAIPAAAPGGGPLAPA